MSLQESTVADISSHLNTGRQALHFLFRILPTVIYFGSDKLKLRLGQFWHPIYIFETFWRTCYFWVCMYINILIFLGSIEPILTSLCIAPYFRVLYRFLNIHELTFLRCNDAELIFLGCRKLLGLAAGMYILYAECPPWEAKAAHPNKIRTSVSRFWTEKVLQITKFHTFFKNQLGAAPLLSCKTRTRFSLPRSGNTNVFTSTLQRINIWNSVEEQQYKNKHFLTNLRLNYSRNSHWTAEKFVAIFQQWNLLDTRSKDASKWE